MLDGCSYRGLFINTSVSAWPTMEANSVVAPQLDHGDHERVNVSDGRVANTYSCKNHQPVSRHGEHHWDKKPKVGGPLNASGKWLHVHEGPEEKRWNRTSLLYPSRLMLFNFLWFLPCWCVSQLINKSLLRFERAKNEKSGCEKKENGENGRMRLINASLPLTAACLRAVEPLCSWCMCDCYSEQTG